MPSTHHSFEVDLTQGGWKRLFFCLIFFLFKNFKMCAVAVLSSSVMCAQPALGIEMCAAQHKIVSLLRRCEIWGRVHFKTTSMCVCVAGWGRGACASMVQMPRSEESCWFSPSGGRQEPSSGCQTWQFFVICFFASWLWGSPVSSSKGCICLESEPING